jgi:hypothetical protein
MRDRRYVAEVREVMESVMTQARATYRPGMTAAELKKAIDVKALREKMAAGDAMIAANFDHMIGDLAVTRAWEELSGKWEPEGLKN